MVRLKKKWTLTLIMGKLINSSITVLSSKTHDSQPFLLYHVSCHVMSDLGGPTTKEVLSLSKTIYHESTSQLQYWPIYSISIENHYPIIFEIYICVCVIVVWKKKCCFVGCVVSIGWLREVIGVNVGCLKTKNKIKRNNINDAFRNANKGTKVQSKKPICRIRTVEN